MQKRTDAEEGAKACGCPGPCNAALCSARHAPLGEPQRKRINLSDAFLRQTIYPTGKRPAYTNILLGDRDARAREKGPEKEPPLQVGQIFQGAAHPRVRGIGGFAPPLFSRSVQPAWGLGRIERMEKVDRPPKLSSPRQNPTRSILLSYTQYNPLDNPQYDTSQFVQLKAASMKYSPILDFVDVRVDDPQLAQHSRLNEIFGLPRILPQNLALTRNALSLVTTSGGLQAVDEKGLWPVIAKEVGYNQGDYLRLRMYYIMVCYLYEQLIMRRQLSPRLFRESSSFDLTVVYLEAKKADTFPELLELVTTQKKQRKAPEAPSPVKAVETSGIAEIACVLNGMFLKGKTADLEELKTSLIKMFSIRCSNAEARQLFSCKEIDAFRAQVHHVVLAWVTSLVASHASADLGTERLVILIYQHYLKLLVRHANRGGELVCPDCPGSSLASSHVPIRMRVLEFLSKSTAFVSTLETAELMELALQGVSDEELAPEKTYLRGALTVYWNILRNPAKAFLPPGSAAGDAPPSLLSSPEFLRVFRFTVSLLNRPFLLAKKGACPGLLEGGELELAVRLASSLSLAGTAKSFGIDQERLVLIWKHLLSLVTSNYFTNDLSAYGEAARRSLAALSSYILEHLICTPAVKSLLPGEWVPSALSSKDTPSEVHQICDRIFAPGPQDALPS